MEFPHNHYVAYLCAGDFDLCLLCESCNELMFIASCDAAQVMLRDYRVETDGEFPHPSCEPTAVAVWIPLGAKAPLTASHLHDDPELEEECHRDALRDALGIEVRDDVRLSVERPCQCPVRHVDDGVRCQLIHMFFAGSNQRSFDFDMLRIDGIDPPRR